jgi:NTP pyrophosphatase (non-canonical NTP hydrolase)
LKLNEDDLVMEVMTPSKRALLDRWETTSTSMETLIDRVEQWHEDRNLIEGATDKDQVCKLIQEVGELSDNVCKGKDVADDIGDIMVVLINIAKRNGLPMSHCLEVAYADIKDRKGKMVDGIFIKEDA